MYRADDKRYETMTYNRCGYSGLKLPAVSLGLWHNFGDTAVYDNMKSCALLPLTTASPTLTWQTITDPNREARRKISAGSLKKIYPPTGMR